MKLFLFFNSSNVSTKISFKNECETMYDKYYNICTSLNELLNSFLYASNNLNNEQSWIFLLKTNTRGRNNMQIPPHSKHLCFDSIDDLNTIIKTLRNNLKKQLATQLALYHQKCRYESYLYANELRSNLDERFIIESIKTTNKTHRQRLKNLQDIFDNIPDKVLSLKDIFFKLEWLIFIESKNFLNHPPVEVTANEFGDILNLAWETLTPSDLTHILVEKQ